MPLGIAFPKRFVIQFPIEFLESGRWSGGRKPCVSRRSWKHYVFSRFCCSTCFLRLDGHCCFHCWYDSGGSMTLPIRFDPYRKGRETLCQIRSLSFLYSCRVQLLYTTCCCRCYCTANLPRLHSAAVSIAPTRFKSVICLLESIIRLEGVITMSVSLTPNRKQRW